MATAIHDLVDTDRDALRAQFRRDVLTGLSQPRKAIPARWFYDHRGSELFEEITRLPEYYPTRTETSILMAHATRLGRLIGARHHVVVEFGAGSATKTPLLLDAIWTAAYVPIDISGEFLSESCETLAQRYPDLPIYPVEADFMEGATLPPQVGAHPRLGFFPGSTIGNMEPMAATDLLRSMRRTLGSDSLLLIGFDRIKDERELVAAYDDAQGVTAAFNLNLAARINQELGGTIPLDALVHRAIWNDARARIEMHIETTRDIAFDVCGRRFTMRAGETIHTENSHKYDPRSADTLLLAGGWEPLQRFCDGSEKFMVILARAIGEELTA
ncbi:L-histidine N(alpha)-methyltransferase [Novosphingobium panipatense]|uniref:Dimethylhistidine N-methyltransferase n=1 Tax=Novosphingobium panipatense TaxID=428991 RepID=A0ABY1PZ83_9SPHN|nr:L-histidine N(alpha)-methyltransferase [Novosphingobium panipatense]SMP52791.1 dimethylhistidine N-methyltransferase [Novosphingobium panipatense]